MTLLYQYFSSNYSCRVDSYGEEPTNMVRQQILYLELNWPDQCKILSKDIEVVVLGKNDGHFD